MLKNILWKYSAKKFDVSISSEESNPLEHIDEGYMETFLLEIKSVGTNKKWGYYHLKVSVITLVNEARGRVDEIIVHRATFQKLFEKSVLPIVLLFSCFLEPHQTTALKIGSSNRNGYVKHIIKRGY